MDLGQYSVKVSEHFQNPKFLIHELVESNTSKEKLCYVFESPRLQDSITFIVELMNEEEGIGFKEVFFNTKHQGIEIAFVDTVCELLKGTRLTQASGLSVKAVEEYLRDNPTTPSFPNHATKMYPIFEFVKGLIEHVRKTLFQEGENASGRKSPSITYDYLGKEHQAFDPKKLGPFKDLGQNEQLQVARQVIEVHVRPFLWRDQGDINLIHADESMAIISYSGACFNCQFSLTTTLDYIQQVFRHELNVSRFLIATDS